MGDLVGRAVKSARDCRCTEQRAKKLSSFNDPTALRFLVVPIAIVNISRNSLSIQFVDTPTHSSTKRTAARNIVAKVEKSFASINTGSNERSLTQITSRRYLVKSRFPYQSPSCVVAPAPPSWSSAWRRLRSLRVHRTVTIGMVDYALGVSGQLFRLFEPQASREAISQAQNYNSAAGRPISKKNAG